MTHHSSNSDPNSLGFFDRLRLKFSSNNLYGAFLIVLSGICTALGNSLTHSLPKHFSSPQILFLKSSAGLVLLLILFFGKWAQIFRTKIIHIHIVKSIFGALGNWFWILALLYLPMAQSSALSLTSVLFTSLGGWLLFREPFKSGILWALVLGSCGVYLSLHPENYQVTLYTLFPLLSAFCFSGSSLIIKRLAQDDSSLTTLVYLMALMALFSAVPAVIYWIPLQATEVMIFAAIGTLYTLTQMCLIEAYTYGAASYIAPFKFSRFPLNVLAGMIFFLEIPSFQTLGGGCLIILGYVILTRKK